MFTLSGTATRRRPQCSISGRQCGGLAQAALETQTKASSRMVGRCTTMTSFVDHYRPKWFRAHSFQMPTPLSVSLTLSLKHPTGGRVPHTWPRLHFALSSLPKPVTFLPLRPLNLDTVARTTRAPNPTLARSWACLGREATWRNAWRSPVRAQACLPESPHQSQPVQHRIHAV